MIEEDSRKTWDEFYQGKKAEREAEAAILWNQMETAGVGEDDARETLCRSAYTSRVADAA